MLAYLKHCYDGFHGICVKSTCLRVKKVRSIIQIYKRNKMHLTRNENNLDRLSWLKSRQQNILEINAMLTRTKYVSPRLRLPDLFVISATFNSQPIDQDLLDQFAYMFFPA